VIDVALDGRHAASQKDACRFAGFDVAALTGGGRRPLVPISIGCPLSGSVTVQRHCERGSVGHPGCDVCTTRMSVVWNGEAKSGFDWQAL
jgi:hypothetical protein